MQRTSKTAGIVRTRSLATIWAIWLAASAAQAMINPHFTPVHLVRESAWIVSVDLKQGESKDQCDAVIREVLKGKVEMKQFRLDLTKARSKTNADMFRNLAATGGPALFFVGEFEGAQGPGSIARERHAFLHVSGTWAVFLGGQDGRWVFDNIDRMLQTVWWGGTDMLRRAVDYILEDDDPNVPVRADVSWSEGPTKLAAIEGAIKAVRPIDLDGNGAPELFVACETGDHLLIGDGGKSRTFTDMTAARGLRSKSRAFAWGDFDGGGRLDLISFDGKDVTLHAQRADGKFQAKPLDLGPALATGCSGLATLDVGNGRAGLIVSGEAFPAIVALDAEGKATVTTLTAPGVELAKLSKAGSCLVADFDGDGLADVLALREAGSVLFRALAPGKFAPGVACAVKLGKSPSAACLGDFDSDGRFDVLGVNSDGIYLWQNEGDGKFTETLDLNGELAYGAQRRGIDCMAGEINNDGRQDVAIAYSVGYPMLFFNCGFRSFGFAQELNLGWAELLPAAEKGQQSACFGDLDGDGAQDLALALRNGEVWVVFRENSDPHRQAMMAVVTLPVGGRYKGPVAVTGWAGKRCLGVWNVQPGVSRACFGSTEAGTVTLKWRMPGGKEQSKEVVLEKGGIVRVELK